MRKPDIPPRKRKTRDAKSDDSSVDSKGNIRDLIDYDADDTSDSTYNPPKKTPYCVVKPTHKRTNLVTEDNKTEKVPTTRPQRKAKLEAEKKIRKILRSEETETTDPKPKPKRTLKKVEHMDVTDEHDTDVVVPKRHPQKSSSTSNSKNKHMDTSSEEEDEDEDMTSDSDEDDDEEDDDEDDSEEENGRKQKNTFDIIISDMLGGGGPDPNKPKKYNMKKEPEAVRRFVKLVQHEDEAEDTIDNDITYFKSLTPEKQAFILRALEIKVSPVEVQVPLKFKILEKVAMKPELTRIAMAKYNALCNLEPSSSEYYKCSHWITGFTDLPLGIYKNLPVSLEDGPEKCSEFMTKVHSCMESAIYGHEEAKLQIMQFVSSWIANPKSNGNVLSIHGPPGTGKTSLIKDGVAKALERPFHFITLGGATDASFLDGHSYTYEGSTWGKIADVLMQSKCMNPIIYFDELDKVSETPKGDEINNLLIHLTDGSQNDRFQDKYFTGLDFDLSRCLFIFSHNNNEKVNPILRDRMYTIQVQGFALKDKLLIAENYLLVAALKDAGLFEKMTFSKDILQHIVENFTGGEAGVRELKRCIQTIISKINLLRFYNNPKQVPFSIKDFSLPFTLKKEHIELFLKKKEELNPSISHLYT